MAVAPVAEAGPLDVHADGSVTVDGTTYQTMSEWHQSEAFVEGGHRCASPKPPEIVTNFAPQDCSFSLTSIEDDYEPDAGQEYVIPVVFHVLHSGAQGNLDESLLTSQIDILNEDFLALAGTPGAPGNNSKISFELATVDPDGNPTNGIERHNMFFNNANAGDTFAWDPRSYLNIYTANIGALGYVRAFPQQIAGQQEDGVWLLYTSVGRNSPGGGQFNQGRTATHEVGHYLGLFHTFQGGCGTGYTSGDLIADTTPESGPASGCPAGQTSCGGQPLPYQNYMDYSDDRCMDHFTPEQINRMRCTITHYRTQLFNAKPIANFDFTNVTDDFSFEFTDNSSDADGSVVAWSWDFGDGTTSNEQNPSHTYAEYGAYEVRLTVTDDRGVFGTTVQTVAANIAPNADFDFDNTDVTAEFFDTSSDTNGTIVAWEWDFGDGTTGTSQNPIHVYPELGKYTVTLTATDDLGGKATISKEIDLTGGCGCSSSTGQTPWGNIALFGLAFALIGWRRRRR